MSLIRGINLATIEEHLAVLYVLTINPDRKFRGLEHVLYAGRKSAHEIMKPLYEEYGFCNSDYGRTGAEAFGRDTVASLENKIVEIALASREKVLKDSILPGFDTPQPSGAVQVGGGIDEEIPF
jgi:hypothetical protein